MIKWLLRLFNRQQKQLNSVRTENVEIDEKLAWAMCMQEYGA